MRRRTIILLGGAAVSAAALPVAAYGFLALNARDAPERAALDAAPEASGAGPGSPEGTWIVADVPTNFVGYRVRERLGPVAAPSDAVSRTNQVEGTATIDDGRLTALDVTVDMASLDSGSPRRDEFVREEALQVGRFPTGELHLGEPVEVGVPDPPNGTIELSVAGQLTLGGETNDVVFEVQARWNGPTIQAAGATEIERSDFGIDVSSRAGFNIDERGTIEFELTLSPQGAQVDAPPPTLVDNPATATDEGEFRPPCQSDDNTVRLDPPVLVTGTVPESDSTHFEIVSGAQQVAPVQTSTGLAGGASWSPDGSRIVYSASASVDAPRTLAVVGSGGGAPAPLPGLTGVTQPDWGADDEIVFVRGSESDGTDIWIAEPDGSDARVLVETPGADGDPRWSPDGRTVVFTTVDGANNQDVVMVGRDGRGLRTVVSGAGYEYTPSFTPDGAEVLFVRDGSIFVVALDGDHERRLTDGPSDINPAISPAGDQLAFLRKGSLYLADADGSEPACVVTHQSIGGGPRWQP
jgi:polyisoprenoid-binding protein YceI